MTTRITRRRALALAASALLAGCGLAQPRAAAPSQPVASGGGAASSSGSGAQVAGGLASSPYTDVNPYGVNTFLEREVEQWKTDKTLDLLQQANIGWIKQQFLWAGIETSKGQLNWDKWDTIVRKATDRGIKVIARLDYTPAWAQKSPDPNAPPDDLAAYADFVYQFAHHYAGKVAAVQIWNEPNLAVEWGGRPPDPAGYVSMLKLAYQRAKGGDPSVIVLSAPLAETLERSPRAMVELEYLQKMYDAGARGSFDVLSANAYGLAYPPDDAPSPDRLNFQRFTLLHDVMGKNGDATRAIWFNEYGWNASPADMSPEKLIWSRVSREQQASYTVDGIQRARSTYPYVGVVCIWYFRQVGDIPEAESSYYFDMVSPTFDLNPVYTAVQQAAGRKVGFRGGPVIG